MKSYHLKNRTGRRSAFTLVEMLMVILIIGILVGLVGSAALGAYRAAQEFTITQEVMQLEAQIEMFKTKYGFYPPTIGQQSLVSGTLVGVSYPEVRDVTTMRRYLNRIAPNNAEGNGSPGTRLGRWWENVGRHLDEKSSLVFWLSGLCKSKQYPLSGSAAIANGTAGGTLVPYNADRFIGDPADQGLGIERDVQFEFSAARLVDLQGRPTGVKGYAQPSGKDTGEDGLVYRYLDNKSYQSRGATPVPVAYYDGIDTAATPSVPNFYNPDTFQIVASGLDGLIWQPVNSATGVARAPTEFTTNIQAVDEGQLDNITNFTRGRLDIEADQ